MTQETETLTYPTKHHFYLNARKNHSILIVRINIPKFQTETYKHTQMLMTKLGYSPVHAHQQTQLVHF